MNIHGITCQTTHGWWTYCYAWQGSLISLMYFTSPAQSVDSLAATYYADYIQNPDTESIDWQTTYIRNILETSLIRLEKVLGY